MRAWRTSTGLLFCMFACAIAAVTPGAAETGRSESAATAQPAILFVCGDPGWDCQLRTWDDWVASGFQVALLPMEKAASLAVLRQFNVVVINLMPDVNPQGHVDSGQRKFEQAFETYLQRGGGAVVFAGGGEWGRMTPALNHLLEPYDARVADEQVVDPQHVIKQVGVGAVKLPVSATDRIAKAPMTRGVSRLGYISQTLRADAVKMAQPVVLEPGSPWQVIARADGTAYAAVAKKVGSAIQLQPAPGAPSGPPILAAARDVGRGRLLLFPQNIAPTVGSPKTFDSYLWDPQDEHKPGVPQNRTFIMQAVRWAAHPSLASGVFGGYRTQPDLRPDRRFILPRGHAIDWAKEPSVAHLVPAFGRFRGLIGAQSTFSGGSHTVAELSAAARAAGLSFLGFTEQLEDLDPRKWAALEQECRRQSDAHFLAIPGIAARDRVGNRYFALGWGAFPKPPGITPDGRRIDQLYWFWAHSFGTRFVGVTDVEGNPNPWFEMKQISAFAIQTVRGARIDDATGDFLRSSYDMENYLPVAFTSVSTPKQVKAAAAGVVNVFSGSSLQELHDYVAGSGTFAGKDMFWEGVHPWYVTSGPTLAYDGGIRLGSLGVDEELENTFRYGFRIEGLQSGDRVLLMDGPTVYREWRADGRVFTTEHTWPHEQTRAFVIRVVRDGRTLLVSSPATVQWARRFNQSGDRQNTIPYDYQPDSDGRWYVTGSPIGPKYKAWSPGTLVAGTFKNPVGAVGVEYAPILGIGWVNSPRIPFQAVPQVNPFGFASDEHQLLSCPGILVVKEDTRRRYPDDSRQPGDSEPPARTVSLDRFNLVQRRYGLYGAIGQLNGQLVESRLRALKDSDLKGKEPLVRVSSFLNVPAAAGRSLELDLGGVVRRIPLADGKTLRVNQPMQPGDYIGVYPYGLAGGGAQYAVSGPLVAHVKIGGAVGFLGNLLLRVPAHWKSGEEFDYNVLYTTGGSLPNRPRSDYQAAARFLGLRGPFPAIERLSGGTLLSQPVIATIKTSPANVIHLRTRFEPNAPLGLPIRIRGFNPNWQVAYTLDGSSRWWYMGELDGDFYFLLYTQQGAHTVLAGQPLLADQPELRIELDDPLGRQGAFEIYNPTAKPMTAHLHTNPAFFPPQQFELTLPPYTSRPLRVDRREVDP